MIRPQARVIGPTLILSVAVILIGLSHFGAAAQTAVKDVGADDDDDQG